MRFKMKFITPVTTKSGEVRKLHFEGPAGEVGTLLAGPWSKVTKVCKGLLDGVSITTPYSLPVVMKQTENGPILKFVGGDLFAEGELVGVVDAENKPVLGADKKPLMNLKVSGFSIVTYSLEAGDDEPALGDPFAEPAIV